MGYFQHNYANWKDSDAALEPRICTFCGGPFYPNAPNQKRHCYDPDDSDSSACAWHYELDSMGPRQYLNHVGMTKKEYIEAYGIEQYNLVVVGNEVTQND